MNVCFVVHMETFSLNGQHSLQIAQLCREDGSGEVARVCRQRKKLMFGFVLISSLMTPLQRNWPEASAIRATWFSYQPSRDFTRRTGETTLAVLFAV